MANTLHTLYRLNDCMPRQRFHDHLKLNSFNSLDDSEKALGVWDIDNSPKLLSLINGPIQLITSGFYYNKSLDNSFPTLLYQTLLYIIQSVFGRDDIR